MLLNEFINENKITMTCKQVSYVPEMGDDKWMKESFHWLVTITCGKQSMQVTYHMGSGHVRIRPIPPKLSDVLGSLRLETSCLNESFSEWCSNFGYSDDSIKALSTYQKCQEEGNKLKKLLGYKLFEVLLTCEE